MSLSFQEIKNILQANVRAVGKDVDAMRGELAKLRMVNFQLMSNMATIVDVLKAHNIECKFESIVEASAAPIAKDTTDDKA